MRIENEAELDAYLKANPGLTVAGSSKVVAAKPEHGNAGGNPAPAKPLFTVQRFGHLVGEPAPAKPHKRDNPHERFILQIVDLAHLNGWRAVYWRPGRTLTGWATPVGGDGKDFPDLFICRKRTGKLEIGWLEVKIPPDKVRTGQQIWLDYLGGKVVTPADWDKLIELLK